MTEQNFMNVTEPEIQQKTSKTDSPLKHPWLVLAVIVCVAIITNEIFIDQGMGVQWAIFVALLLVAIAATVLIERLAVPKRGMWLLVPIVGLTVLYLYRAESFSTAALVIATILCLVWLATSFLHGNWAKFRLRELISQTFKLILDAISALPIMLIENLRGSNAVKKDGSIQKSANKTAWAILRGVLISVPILAIFGGLLASADAIFSGNLRNLFAWIGDFSFERFLGETILVGFITYILFGLFSFALTKTRQSPQVDPDQPLIKPFLGITEATIVFASVNLLFLAFLVVQFRYFFAGEAIINPAGLTYSEYAVKGFQELVMVACGVLGLHWLLAGITRRENKHQKLLFSVLVTVAIIQVGIILVSAYQRENLYIEAYGFTQSRLVALVFNVFVGLLLVAALWMQWRDAFRYQALVLASLFVIFALTLGVINMDRTVARLNLVKSMINGKLDAAFMANRLSVDAVPVMFEYYDQKLLPPDLRQKLGKVLACQANFIDQERLKSDPWFAVSLPDRAAARLFEAHAAELGAYTLEQKTWEDGFIEKGFTIDDVWIGCNFNYHPLD